MTIKEIQKQLKKDKINARLFTLGNLFINEDILPSENQILELTGFTGSYAILFITQNKTYLFVDGRYEIQAKKEVNIRQIEIVKITETSFERWLAKNFAKTPITINYNSWTTSIKYLKHLQKVLPNSKFIPLKNSETLLSTNSVKTITHQKKFNSLSSKDKLACVLRNIKNNNLDAYLVTSASNASWLLNLRSNALPYTPILRAYVLVDKSGSYKIFAEHTDLNNALPFEELKDHLKKYNCIGTDFTTTPDVLQSFTSNLIDINDCINNLKATKTPSEIKSITNAHLKDGVALTKFMFWLTKNYKHKTEIDVAEKLLDFRKKELNFHSESFATIAGYGTNSAIIHYCANEKTNRTIKKGSILLLDSGGQYFDGTTDVTRTIAIGEPTPDMVEKNTLVLKSHIALATAIFPQDTKGSELDLIARQPLLKLGMDYNHGTGHGVGYFSNVHEGPHCISIKAKNSAPLKAGMITSIEPGYYKENAFGIRIENLYQVKATKNPKFLEFDVLTLAPLDKKLINKYLLSQDEIKWVDDYHSMVFSKLKKYLSKQELEWLKSSCSPL